MHPTQLIMREREKKSWVGARVFFTGQCEHTRICARELRVDVILDLISWSRLGVYKAEGTMTVCD